MPPPTSTTSKAKAKGPPPDKPSDRPSSRGKTERPKDERDGATVQYPSSSRTKVPKREDILLREHPIQLQLATTLRQKCSGRTK
eukprot:877780-Amphidinium_carterae.1